MWSIALSVEGLTSTDASRRRRILEMLLRTTGGTGYMHEGVNCNNPDEFRRPWFSWSNAMFCELALDTTGYSRPVLVNDPLL